MTEEERRNAFALGLVELQQRYGLEIRVSLQHEQLGVVLQVRPMLTLVVVPGWKGEDREPTTEESAGEHAPNATEQKHIRATP